MSLARSFRLPPSAAPMNPPRRRVSRRRRGLALVLGLAPGIAGVVIGVALHQPPLALTGVLLAAAAWLIRGRLVRRARRRVAAEAPATESASDQRSLR